MLLGLDKVADALKAGGNAESAIHIIQHIILAHGLLIGISWEVCFALSMHLGQCWICLSMSRNIVRTPHQTKQLLSSV